jgi:hypothetical protein
MSINPRRKRHLKQKIVAYIFLLGMLGFVVYLLNAYIISTKPLYINPIGKAGLNQASVEKILQDNGILFSSITSSDYYSINIQNNGQVKLSKTKNFREQVASLQRILRELTIEGKQFKSIDFRFSEPIISF